ncbi:MAG: hypothetical protein NT022_11500, partial [Deltaproteobacteria bacterium]|nr:hypothetical protein [Deltaproteobacteria bacterium]
LALAGKDYALIKNLGDTSASYPSGRDFTMANQDKFRLDIAGNVITSTGIVNEGTPREARRKITITKLGFGSQSDISGFAGMTPKIQSGSSFVQVNGAGTTASLGRWESGRFGALWYSGGAVQGNCTGGKCSFGPGFRAFFVFKFDAGSSGDGFTFAFFNGGVDINGIQINDINAVGGDTGRGELLGYAGDSRYYDSIGVLQFLDLRGGRGIQPPKMAIEFDPYSNCCDSPPCGSCKNNICSSNSRYDGDYNHMAYVFWGDTTISSCHTPATIGSNTYDDNKHGAGSGGLTEPQNARSYRNTGGIDLTSYFNGSALGFPSNWLLNSPTNIYAFRVEVTRASTQNSNTNYFYTVSSWIKQCNLADCSDVITSSPGYDNTKIPYTPQPTLIRTIELDQTYHNYFTTFFFGWTAATGGATQNITLSNFKMNFIKETSGCGGYGVWNNLGSGAYFRISGVGCSNIANNAFIGNFGPSGFINGFTDAACTIPSAPGSITIAQASTADTNKNCAVYFTGADK